jgi:hypothetical protein
LEEVIARLRRRVEVGGIEAPAREHHRLRIDVGGLGRRSGSRRWLDLGRGRQRQRESGSRNTGGEDLSDHAENLSSGGRAPCGGRAI